MSKPVHISKTDYLPEGSPQRIIADAIRDAALDAIRDPEGSGTGVIDCGGRAGTVLRLLVGLD